MGRFLGWLLFAAVAVMCLVYAVLHLCTGTGVWDRVSAIGAYVLFGWLLLAAVYLLGRGPSSR